MKTALLIYNPLSGRGDEAGSLETDQIDIIERVSIIENMKIMNEVLNKHDYDVIILAGGDGTVSSGFSMLNSFDVKTPILVLPLGTTNDIARSHYTTLDTNELLASIKTSEIRSIDLCKANQHTFTYALTFGYLSDVPYKTDQDMKKKIGYLAYMLNAFTKIIDVSKHNLVVETDDIMFEDGYSFCAITNTRSIANLVKFPDSVQLDDGKIELLLVKTPKTPSRFLASLSRLRRQKYDNNHVILESSKSITISSDKNIEFGIDGEYGGTAKQLRIHVIEKAINLIGPHK